VPVSDETPEPLPSSDVHVIELDGRRIVLVGTAHISRDSVETVRQTIEEERPDHVCVELDAQRYEALAQKRRWEDLDLRAIIKKQQLATLIASLLLTSYQKRLGGKLGVTPGAELLAAIEEAQARDTPFSLCDRDVRVTLRRAWARLAFYRKLWLLSSLLASAFESPELTEEDLEKLRQQDVLTELMQELGRAMPEIKEVLIDERDAYLAEKIRTSPGERIVAVVGAGHVAGMRTALEAAQPVDLAPIEVIPPVSPVWKVVGWAIPALIISAIAYIGITKGSQAAGENAMFWFLANSVPCAIGGVIALGHPLTILAGFIAAPFTSLTPLIGAGYVTAFVQTMVKPPTVREFQSVGDDVGHVRRWWSSRLLRILLVFGLTTLGSAIGTWVGGVEIVSNLF